MGRGGCWGLVKIRICGRCAGACGHVPRVRGQRRRPGRAVARLSRGVAGGSCSHGRAEWGVRIPGLLVPLRVSGESRPPPGLEQHAEKQVVYFYVMAHLQDNLSPCVPTVT